MALLPFALVFALLGGTIAVRGAGSAVITFTNFPAAVSNTYNGTITLQINGLTNGVTNVVVQKFLDLNTNGVIDAGDLLVQQFQLTLGQAPVFTNVGTTTTFTATNFLPGDMALAPGQITAPLNFQNGDFAQTLAAHYLYKVYSPSNPAQFLPVTNLFVVTNSSFTSSVTGAVQNANDVLISTNVPYSIVLLCVQQSGPLNVQAGTVANKLGNFSINAPPGNYFLAAGKTNFVDASLPIVDLSAGQTNFQSVDLTPATTNIVGSVVDAATGSGLPGLSGVVLSTNNYLSFYFTDPNGNYRAPVTGTNAWQPAVDPFAAAFAGYLMPQAGPLLNVTNKAVSVTTPLVRAEDIFYGVVSNSQAVPMTNVYLYANDNTGNQSYGMTVQNGQYVVLAGTNQWDLSILATNNPGLTNPYVFSPGPVQFTFTNVNQAFQQNFTLANAPFTIQGTVQDINGNPLAGIEVYAISTNTPGYQAFPAYTAANGSYTLNVSPDTTWTVGISSNSLASLGNPNVPAQTVPVSDASVSGINFIILISGQIQITPTNLPDATVGSYYSNTLQAISSPNNTNWSWSTAYGVTLTPLYQKVTNTYPPGAILYSNPKQIGVNESYFSFGIIWENGQDTAYESNCTVANYNGSAGTTIVFNNVQATINVSAPIYQTTSFEFSGHGETWTASPTTQSGSTYSTTVSLGSVSLTGNGGIQPYNVNSGSMMTGSSGSSNTLASIFGNLPPITNGFPLNLASTIPYTSSNNVVVWYRTTRGTNQYLISAYGPQTNTLPLGITLSPNGTLAGTPYVTYTTNEIIYYPPHPKPREVINIVTNGIGTNYFTVAVRDPNGNTAVQPLSILVSLPPDLTTTITVPSTAAAGMLLSSNIFPLQVNGVVSGQTYTILMATNLLSGGWTPIFSTNAANTNALFIPDPNATNRERFYRIQITP